MRIVNQTVTIVKQILLILSLMFAACFNLSAADNVKNSTKQSAPSTFFKEGRTYWYMYKHPYFCTDVEFGITIAAKESIDGKEWYRIDLTKRAKHNYDSSDNYLGSDVDNSPVTVAYLTEENGNIYRSLKGTEFYNHTLAHPWSALIYGGGDPEEYDNPDIPIYGYGAVGFTTNVARLRQIHDMECEATVTEVSTIENSGRTYNVYTLVSTHPDEYFGTTPKAVIIESVGAFGPYSSDDVIYPASVGCGELIYDPLRPAMSGIDYNPQLTYITEGDNNTIIFEKAGGNKLWETFTTEGIETIESDPAAPRWYNLQGVRIPQPETPGIYIRCTGTHAQKVRL